MDQRATVSDLERRLAEAEAALSLKDERLRESEARHRLLIKSLAQAVWETDAHGVVVADSPSWRAYTGQTLEEWLGYGWLDAIHPNERAYAERQWREAVSVGGLVNAEFRLRAPDGEWRWTNVRAAPMPGPGGSIEKWTGMNIDIDARKRAEVALRESEEQFRAFVTASSDVIYRMSPDWTEMRTLDGRSFLADTVSPRGGWLAAYIDPADQPQVMAVIQSAIRSKATFKLEHRVRRVDGSLGWTLSRAVPLLDTVGEIREWFGTATNVTARKDAEESLRTSEMRFRTLADTAPALIWRNDENGENLFINEFFLAFTGKSADAIRGEGWHTLVHPDDIEEYVADYLAAVHERRAWQNRNRIWRHDGQWRWFENYAQPLFGEDGSYLGDVGVSTDITTIVAGEVALRESEARFQALFAASPVPFMVLDPHPPDFTITAANDAYLAATLTTRDGLIGRKLFDVFTDDPLRPGMHGSEALAISLNRVLTSRRTDAMPRVHYDLVVPGGFEPHWWLAINAPMLNAAGDVAAIIHQVKRETELHLAEEAERERQERQAFMLKLSDALRPLSDAVEIQEAACRVVGEHLHADWAQYTEVDFKTRVISTKRGFFRDDLPSHVGEYPLDDYPVHAQYWEAGRTLAIDDVELDATLSEGERLGLITYDVRATLTTSLVKGDLSIVMNVLHGTVRHAGGGRKTSVSWRKRRIGPGPLSNAPTRRLRCARARNASPSLPTHPRTRSGSGTPPRSPWNT